MVMPQPSKFLSVRQKLLESWSRRLAEPRQGIHVSDTMLCLRRTAFQRLDRNPPTTDLKKIKYFHQGIMKHQLLQDLLGKEEFEIEKEIVYTCKNGLKIIAHPDLIYKKDGAVIEIKTTESTSCQTKYYKHHADQAKAYVAMLGARYAVLLYIILGYTKEAGTNYFPEYILKVSEDERRKILEKLERDATELQRGLDERDPSLVRHVAYDKEYMNRLGRNWVCENCDYSSLCSALRAKERESIFNVKNIKTSRSSS